MLYTVTVDKDMYILSIGHTSNDNVELDLDSMELEYLNAYQLLEGVVFTNCFSASQSGTMATDNTCLIPLAIYGIK